MTSRTGQGDHQGVNLPERERSDHDAAPAARASKPEASAADSALPDAGTGDTPESQATPGEGSVQADDWHISWRDAAMRLGQRLEPVGPLGYYSYTAGGWLQWATGVVLSLKPTLTDAEREAIEKAIGRELDAEWYGGPEPGRVVALRGLLERTT